MILAPADLNIELERAERRWAPGEIVRGRVAIHVKSPFLCSGVRIGVRFATHGKGDVDKATTSEVTAMEGVPLAAGAHFTPFELQLPAHASPTYHGRVVNLDWYIEARIDVPFAIDPKVREDILVALPSRPPKAIEMPVFVALARLTPNADTPAFAYSSQSGWTTMSPKTSAILGGVWIAATVAVIGWLARDLRPSERFTSSTLATLGLFGLFIGGIGLWILLTSLRSFWSDAALRRVEVHVGPFPTDGQTGIARGSRVACVVFVATAGRARVKRVKLVLTSRETAKRKSGTTEQTFIEDVALDEAIADEPYARRPAGGATYRVAPPHVDDLWTAAPDVPAGCAEYRAVVALPDGAPHPFSLARNKVAWTLGITVALSGAPDWEQLYELDEAIA